MLFWFHLVCGIFIVGRWFLNSFMSAHSSYSMTTPKLFFARPSSSPTRNNSTMVVRSSLFNNNSSHPRYFQNRDNPSLTFNYMAYMFSSCKGHLSVLLRAIHWGSSCPIERHKLLFKYAVFHVLLYVFDVLRGRP